MAVGKYISFILLLLLVQVGFAQSSTRSIGFKNFEVSNHLNNITEVTSDRKVASNLGNVIAYNEPDVLSFTDYYPYGMQQEKRSNNGNNKYGFQGQEKDEEVKGEGNSINYKYRMHDPRAGRFFAVDPLFKEYPANSSYAFSENRTVDAVELEGLEMRVANRGEFVLDNQITTFTSAELISLRQVFNVSLVGNSWSGEQKKTSSQSRNSRRRNFSLKPNDKRLSNTITCVDCTDYYIRKNQQDISKGKRISWPKAGNVEYRIDNYWQNMISSSKDATIQENPITRQGQIRMSKQHKEYVKQYAFEISNFDTAPSQVNITTATGVVIANYNIPAGQSVIHVFTKAELASMSSQGVNNSTNYNFQWNTAGGTVSGGIYKKK